MKAQILARVAPIALAAAVLGGCNMTPAEIYSSDEIFAGNETIPQGSGYFASESTLPFHAPDFDAISEDDYMPAFEQGMEIQRAEVASIVNNPEAPTFENTIVALEKTGLMLGRVSAVFFALTGNNTTDRIDEINTEISPLLTAHYDAIDLDPGLFARVRIIGSGEYEALLLPDEAVLSDQARKIVLVVDAEGNVGARVVELGPLHQGLRVIRAGITADDTVIVNGVLRARPGGQVVPEETVLTLDEPETE